MQSKYGLFAKCEKVKSREPLETLLNRGKFPSLFSLFRVLNHRWVLNFDKSFSAFIEINARFFPLYVDNVVNHKGEFQVLNQLRSSCPLPVGSVAIFILHQQFMFPSVFH